MTFKNGGIMIEKIELGDIVMVVRWPCCGAALGKIWRVDQFHTWQYMLCAHCYSHIGSGQLAASNDRHASKPEWLKKLKPPSADELGVRSMSLVE